MYHSGRLSDSVKCGPTEWSKLRSALTVISRAWGVRVNFTVIPRFEAGERCPEFVGELPGRPGPPRRGLVLAWDPYRKLCQHLGGRLCIVNQSAQAGGIEQGHGENGFFKGVHRSASAVLGVSGQKRPVRPAESAGDGLAQSREVAMRGSSAISTTAATAVHR